MKRTITVEVPNERTAKIGKIKSNFFIRVPIDYSKYLGWKKGDIVKIMVIDKNRIIVKK